jgi:hypothetical protein
MATSNSKKKKVDSTVENQENPFSHVTERESTNTDQQEPTVPKMAPANEVDETVVNQENPGGAEMVDRHPEPVIYTDDTGIKYDVGRAHPELVTSNPEEDKRKARVRQTESVMDAKNLVEDEDKDSRNHIEIEFLESGLTAQGRVWKAGQVLRMEDTESNRNSNKDADGDLWYELSKEEQKNKYGKAFFEKR